MAGYNPFDRKNEFTDDDGDQEASLPSFNEGLLAAANAAAGVPTDEGLVDLLGEDDETIELKKSQASESERAGAMANFQRKRSGASIELRLEENLRDLRSKYPMGGIKTSRFITTEVLLDAPSGYFSHFDDIVHSGVLEVQTAISDDGKSGIIGEAQSNPTDESLQDEAYRVVHSNATKFLDKHPYRSVERAIIISMISNEIIGFGPLDPLWRDRSIDEIICNGPKDIQIEVRGRLVRVPGCQFRDQRHLLTLIERLYSAIGKQLSRTTPIVSGNLHDRSRMEAVHPTVAPDGPNFNIRRHRDGYTTPEQIVEWGTASEELMTDLGNLIYHGANWLIIGSTGSGKTTFLNALTSYIRADSRILTLEDTIEMKPHPGKMVAAAMGCLPARADRPGDMGVTMRDLVKSSLRLRPDTILVGEVRDGAAYDLCQALNTGHSGCSTIHANSPYDAIYRMISMVSQGGLMTGSQTLPLIAAAFDFIIQTERIPGDGSRKVVEVAEVAPYPIINEMTGEQHLPTNPIWRFVEEGIDENGKVLGSFVKVSEISQTRQTRLRMNLEPQLTWEQLQEIGAL